MGDEFFLIESGTAEAIKPINGRDTVVKKMTTGEYFGGESTALRLLLAMR